MRRAAAFLLLMAGALSASVCAADPPALGGELERILETEPRIELGVEVWVEGRGIVLSRSAQTPRAAASAIKIAVAVDLLMTRADLDRVSAPAESVLVSPGHPALSGLTDEERSNAVRELSGKTALELARIMMGRTPADGDVYNAACNLLMADLGGPAAIQSRVSALSPDFRGLDLNRYMETWSGDGDNRATPGALAAIYRAIASGAVPGLDSKRHEMLRDLARIDGDGGEGSHFGKPGTLFPKPMVRVQAGYLERAGGDVAYAIMGEVPDVKTSDPGATFLRLLSAVDALAVICREIHLHLED